jgi:hypothetical protein
MIDTGATLTMLDPHLCQKLNLVPFRLRRATVPNTPVPVRVWSYKIDLGILFAHGFYIFPMLSVLVMPLTHMGVDVLVGCDVLAQCQFIHAGTDGWFSLAY